ncbi:hypothetical protein Tco_0079198 [Tanacetum coccineum]
MEGIYIVCKKGVNVSLGRVRRAIGCGGKVLVDRLVEGPRKHEDGRDTDHGLPGASGRWALGLAGKNGACLMGRRATGDEGWEKRAEGISPADMQSSNLGKSLIKDKLENKGNRIDIIPGSGELMVSIGQLQGDKTLCFWQEALDILKASHSGPYWGHYGAQLHSKKNLRSGFLIGHHLQGMPMTCHPL